MSDANYGLLISVIALFIAIVSVWKDVYKKEKLKKVYQRFSRVGVVLLCSSGIFILLNYIKDTNSELKAKRAESGKRTSDSLLKVSEDRIFALQELLYAANVKINSLNFVWDFDAVNDRVIAYQNFAYAEMKARSSGEQFQNNRNGFYLFKGNLRNSLPDSEIMDRDATQDMITLISLYDNYSAVISYGRIAAKGMSMSKLSPSIENVRNDSSFFQGEIPKLAFWAIITITFIGRLSRQPLGGLLIF